MEVYAVIEEFDMSDFSDRHGDTAPDYERVLSIHGTMEGALAEVDRLSAQNAHSVKEFDCDECCYRTKPYKVQQCLAPKKTKMELVWHNCKTCPPEEAHNECLYVWNGERVVQAEWYRNTWLFDVDLASIAIIKQEEADHLWWADLSQTTKAFFTGGE